MSDQYNLSLTLGKQNSHGSCLLMTGLPHIEVSPTKYCLARYTYHVNHSLQTQTEKLASFFRCKLMTYGLSLFSLLVSHGFITQYCYTTTTRGVIGLTVVTESHHSLTQSSETKNAVYGMIVNKRNMWSRPAHK